MITTLGIIGVLAWSGLALCFGIAVGLSIREAERREAPDGQAPDGVDSPAVRPDPVSRLDVKL